MLTTDSQSCSFARRTSSAETSLATPPNFRPFQSALCHLRAGLARHLCRSQRRPVLPFSSFVSDVDVALALLCASKLRAFSRDCSLASTNSFTCKSCRAVPHPCGAVPSFARPPSRSSIHHFAHCVASSLIPDNVSARPSSAHSSSSRSPI